MSIKDLLVFFQNLKLTKEQEEIAHLVVKEIIERLNFLSNVGLGYLTLSRSAGTLSGGEAQKIRLANQKVNLDRAKELLAIGGGTQQTVDQLQAEYDAAMRAYNNAKENTVLTAPMSGVVTAKNNDPGDYTFTNPLLADKMLDVTKQDDGSVVTSWRNMKH